MSAARIAMLTPDPGGEWFHTRWRDVLDRNAAPLREAGFAVEGRCWSSADDLAKFDLVLPLTAWGYHSALDAWRERLAAWQRQGVKLQNPASVLLWNADKAYLGRLGERGAAVVPTLFVDRITAAAMAEAAQRFGAERLVAKPQVSAGAWQTIRWSAGDALDSGPSGAAMIQPYLPSIERDGEVSLIWFRGRFSHAIRKVPQPGDFRVQPEYDGIITRHQPAADELAACEAILAAVAEELLYARIDLVRGAGGEPLLIEIELIEPDLYLGYDPHEGRLFASAVAELTPGRE